MSHVLVRRVGVFAAFALALAVVSMFVLRASSAAFTAQTSNPNNSFTTADVDLTDSEAGVALFNLTDVNQGESRSRCITVTYTGTNDPQPVVFYGGGYTESGTSTLDDYLNLTVVEGNAGVTCVDGGAGDDALSGTGDAIWSGVPVVGGADPNALSNLAASDYASGLNDDWDPAAAPGGESRAYLITLELDDATPDALSGESITNLTFVWETVSG